MVDDEAKFDVVKFLEYSSARGLTDLIEFNIDFRFDEKVYNAAKYDAVKFVDFNGAVKLKYLF